MAARRQGVCVLARQIADVDPLALTASRDRTPAASIQDLLRQPQVLCGARKRTVNIAIIEASSLRRHVALARRHSQRCPLQHIELIGRARDRQRALARGLGWLWE